MEDVNVELSFTANRTGSTRGAITVKLGGRTLLVDTINLAKETARKGFADSLLTKYPELNKNGLKANLEQQLLQAATQQLDNSQERDAEPASSEANQPLYQSCLALEKTEPRLIECAEEFLRRPDMVSQIVRHIKSLGVAGEQELILMLYLIGTSRLLIRPLAGVVMGASSAGKSYVIGKVACLFPHETVLHAHRLTPHALEYMPKGALIHKYVVAGERSRQQDDAAVESTRALREMIADGRLSLALPTKNASGAYETIHIEQPGPIAYVESTTLGISQIFDEDRTRFVLLSSDERQIQTRAVIDQLAKSLSQPVDRDIPDSIIALHHTVQRLLKPCDVIVPFAERLTTILPDERLEVRRTFGHLMSFIQAVALLNQFNRQRNDQGQIIATLDDYSVVRSHLSGPLARSLGRELTPGAADLMNRIRNSGDFTIPEIASQLHLSANTVRGRVKELQQVGQIVQLNEGKGQKAATYRCVANPPPLDGLTLPALDELEEVNLVSAVAELAAHNM